MADPVFRLASRPGALAQAPADWAPEMLAEGEIGLLGGDGGLPEINALAHQLGLLSVTLVRGEEDADAQARTVMTFAAALPLVWVDEAFSTATRAWAHDRGPMTLLVEATGPLGESELRRIERFVATLGRQSE